MSASVIGLWLVVVTLVGSALLPYDAFGRSSALRNVVVLAALAACVAGGLLYRGSLADLGERIAALGADPAAAPAAIVLPAEMPPPQQRLVAAVQRARDAYGSSTNDMARGAARPLRGREVCEAVRDGVATNWTGLVTGLSSRPDGRGVLSVDVGERTFLTTRTNAESDRADGTLIEPGSPVFQQAARLRVGQKVRFSGRFAASDTDCLKEASLTLAASMQRPEYLMVFQQIEPVE